MPKFIVTISRPNFGLEEYDGGNTIAEARAEAAFFVANTPISVPVRICKASSSSPTGLVLVETVRERWSFPLSV